MSGQAKDIKKIASNEIEITKIFHEKQDDCANYFRIYKTRKKKNSYNLALMVSITWFKSLLSMKQEIINLDFIFLFLSYLQQFQAKCL